MAQPTRYLYAELPRVLVTTLLVYRFRYIISIPQDVSLVGMKGFEPSVVLNEETPLLQPYRNSPHHIPINTDYGL